MSYAAFRSYCNRWIFVQALLRMKDFNPSIISISNTLFVAVSALAAALLGGHVDFLAIAAWPLMPHIKLEQ